MRRRGVPPFERYQVPYDDFIPEDRYNSRLGLIVAALILLLASIAMLALNLREGRLVGDADLQGQIDKHLSGLEETRKNLQQLMAYVDGQAKAVRATNETLLAMQHERDKLKPLLETDINAVNALFEAQEIRRNRNWWWEQGITFAFGIISSVVATFLWERFRRWRRAHQIPTPTSPVE
jgi:hypothetical protein